MITFNKTYLKLTTEEITPRKIDTVVITFNSPIKNLLFSAIDGYETSDVEVEGQRETLLTLIQKNLLQKTFSLDEFINKDLLAELHTFYKVELQSVNPDTIFEIK